LKKALSGSKATGMGQRPANGEKTEAEWPEAKPSKDKAHKRKVESGTAYVPLVPA